MVIKLLTFAMVILLVGCGGAGATGDGSKGGNEGKKDSTELIELKKVLEDDYSVYIMLNITSDMFQLFVDKRINDEMAVKINQSFTSSDVNCKSFNFTKVGSGTNGTIKEKKYERKVGSEDSICKEADFIETPDAKGDKNYILFGKLK